MSMESVMPSNHLILCCPFLFLPSIFPSIRVFSNESVLHIRWPKYLSFSFSISPSNGYSELISFRIDWLAFALLHFVLQGQACPLLQVYLDFLLLHSSPLWWKLHLFWVFILEGLVGLHRSFNFSFFGISLWDIDLKYCDIEWFALEMNRDHSVIFEISHKYCILDSFVDYEGYSISSKGFLPTVVDRMVIWIKFTHSSFF